MTGRTVGESRLDAGETGTAELLGNVVDIVAIAHVLIDKAVDLAIVVMLIGIGATLVGGSRDEQKTARTERLAEIGEDSLVGLDMLHHVDGENEVERVGTAVGREVCHLERGAVGHSEPLEKGVAIGYLLILDIDTRDMTAVAQLGKSVRVLAEAASRVEGIGGLATPLLRPLAQSLTDVPRTEQENIEKIVEKDSQARRPIEEAAQRSFYGVVVHRCKEGG